ncbi:MAG: hypothetical protein SVV80_10685 [Planctomycetota bacterium]|nr:hypothetical protein [Planctomycetota bacterium]
MSLFTKEKISLRPSAKEQKIRRDERLRIQRQHGGKWTKAGLAEFRSFLRYRTRGRLEVQE